jgi:hypothetical protein
MQRADSPHYHHGEVEMSRQALRPGRRVRVPWGLDVIEGTITEVFGPPARQFARVRVELAGPDDEGAMEVVTLPVSLLEVTSVVA